MNRGVAGKNVLVTGAASGIGRVAAMVLAREGARVAASDVNEQGAAETAWAIVQDGGTVGALRLDVVSEEDWGSAIARIGQVWGPLHFLVHCAGVAAACPLADMTLAEWRRVMSINLDGAFLALKYALPSMREAGGGAVVLVASASGIKAQPGAAAYSASKAALRMLARAAALECRDRGENIRINTISPAGVFTPMWGISGEEGWKAVGAYGKSPVDRFAYPEEVAMAIRFLLSGESPTITGADLVIDGGYTV